MLFICGCLEPWRDGVGDYSLYLAETLAGHGHQVECVALNDKYVSSEDCYSKHKTRRSHDSIQVFRFSSLTTWNRRFILLREHIDSCGPDWISLQYVPYSFSAKGIPFIFTFNLIYLRGPWKWHIMFHELWIRRQNCIKFFIASLLQEYLVLLASTLLRPKVVHTSVQHYQHLLRKLRMHSDLLPLHGGIPIFNSNEPLATNSSTWIFIFFGTLDRQWQPSSFFEYVEQARKISAKATCHFISIGKKGDRGELLWEAWTNERIRSKYKAFLFSNLGEKSAKEVSLLLQIGSFGVSMAPSLWLGKSSSVATMIEHGLPIIIPTYDSIPDIPIETNIISNEQFLKIDSSLPLKICQASRFPSRSMVLETARSLIKSLS
jgi:hypothetical protein